MELEYDGTIFSLFSILDTVFKENKLPDKIIRKDAGYIFNPQSQSQGELFNTLSEERLCKKQVISPRIYINNIGAAHKYFEQYKSCFSAQEIIKYSRKAYRDILYAWMSEFPIEKDIIYFAFKIVSAGKMQNIEITDDENLLKAKKSAEKARCDMADISIKKVFDAAAKTKIEAHRFMGILRFTVGKSSIPVARCSPDHFILPALAYHFTLRFGINPWAIVDEKRNLLLMRSESEQAKLTVFDPNHSWFKEESDNKKSYDNWENMWKNYHNSVNNESRSNPNLQRRFIPARYWKYLPELEDK